ncbi:hypothetical protein CKM354_000578200 [Cercospora kikuchii]|uniref:Uncharacterized protein n=2 Tax=Cercospora kikuchii TaxID=84275 RepID=A0A9P3CI82_9PEZI|nr:uncharacterized protein CKM354_000578200 [Cercospora kikuchii]GIZ42516.1 hypothetical protein CKM354_000578200 [Cercospora kikuchii]
MSFPQSTLAARRGQHLDDFRPHFLHARTVPIDHYHSTTVCPPMLTIQANGRPDISADIEYTRHSFDNFTGPMVPYQGHPSVPYQGQVLPLEEAQKRDDIRLRGFFLPADRELVSTWSPDNSPASEPRDPFAFLDEYEGFASKFDAALFMTSEVAHSGKNIWQDVSDTSKEKARSFKRKYRSKNDPGG